MVSQHAAEHHLTAYLEELLDFLHYIVENKVKQHHNFLALPDYNHQA